MGNQDEDNFDVFNEDSITDRMIFERSNIRVRVDTISIVENLRITKADLPNIFYCRVFQSKIILLCHL